MSSQQHFLDGLPSKGNFSVHKGINNDTFIKLLKSPGEPVRSTIAHRASTEAENHSTSASKRYTSVPLSELNRRNELVVVCSSKTGSALSRPSVKEIVSNPKSSLLRLLERGANKRNSNGQPAKKKAKILSNNSVPSTSSHKQSNNNNTKAATNNNSAGAPKLPIDLSRASDAGPSNPFKHVFQINNIQTSNNNGCPHPNSLNHNNDNAQCNKKFYCVINIRGEMSATLRTDTQTDAARAADAFLLTMGRKPVNFPQDINGTHSWLQTSEYRNEMKMKIHEIKVKGIRNASRDSDMPADSFGKNGDHKTNILDENVLLNSEQGDKGKAIASECQCQASNSVVGVKR